MKISLSRRVTAVVAALGLALVAVPASAANADDHACGLGETCDGVLSGPLGDSTFKIKWLQDGFVIDDKDKRFSTNVNMSWIDV